MAGPHSTPNVHPRHISHNLVWDVNTLTWIAETQPATSGGGAITVANGADVTQGAIADADSGIGASGTLSAKLRNISANTGWLTPHTIVLEYSGTNVIYIGKAAQGSATSAAVWLIRKLTYDGSNNCTNIQFANGSSAYNAIWDNRASLSYS